MRKTPLAAPALHRGTGCAIVGPAIFGPMAEALESRLLFAADPYTIKQGSNLVANDGSQTATPINIGTIHVGGNASVTFTLLNPNGLDPEFFDTLTQFTVGPLTGSDPAKKTFTVTLKNNTPGKFAELVKMRDEVGDQYLFPVQGTVLPADLGTIGTPSPQTGTISAFDNSDTQGKARVSATQQFVEFSVAGASNNLTVNLSASATSAVGLSPNLELIIGQGTDPDHSTKTLVDKVVTVPTTTFSTTASPTAGPVFVLLKLANTASDSSKSAVVVTVPYTLTLSNQALTGALQVTGGSNQAINGNSTDSSYGSVGIGANSTQTYTIKNTGGGSLNATLKAPSTGDFDIAQGLSKTTLAPGDTATFSIVMLTGSAGSKNATIELDTNDPNNGTFKFNVSGTVQSAAGIQVKGNGNVIGSGDSTPSAGDNTQFPDTALHASGPTQTFTIVNTGGSELDLSGFQVGSGFQFVGTPPGSVPGNSSRDFQVQLLTDTAGVHTANVSFNTTASDTRTFTFTVQGNVQSPASIQVSGNGTNIASADTTVSLADGTDFGTVTQNGAAPTRAFTFHNLGDSELDITHLVVGDGFTLVGQAPAAIPGHGTADLTLQMTTTAVANRHATVSFATNDPSHGQFSFDVGGVIQSAPVTTPGVSVTGGGTVIASGDSTPLTTDGTDFGVAISGIAQTHTFVIQNTGTGDDLVLGAGALSAGGFTVSGLPVTIAAGATANITVQFLATTAGESNATLSFSTNVPGVSTFSFALHGTVPAAQAAPATLGGTVIGQSGAGLAGQTVFLDTNANGIADAGETSVTTDASGNYTLGGLLPGSYHVVETPTAGLSVAEPATAAHDVTLGEGQIQGGVNFANVPTAVASGSDLTVAFSGGLPASVIGGSKGQVKLKITNAGGAAATGVAKVALLVSSDGTLSGTLLALPAVSLGKLNLKPHASKLVTVKFNFPSSLADGSYKLVAEVDSTNAIAETNKANNIAASNVVTIAKPFVDLSGTLGKITPIAAGKKASVALLLSNAGNMPVKGNPTFSFYESTDSTLDAGDVLVGSVKKSINLKAASKGSLTLSFKPTGTVKGSAFLIAVIDSANAISEKNEGNNTASSAAAISFA